MLRDIALVGRRQSGIPYQQGFVGGFRQHGFIYPISDSKWVSPLVVVPNKFTGKWHICVDFRELNNATLKDYFPFPFIDQVLDTLSGKKYFSFLDGYSGYNQILIAPKD